MSVSKAEAYKAVERSLNGREMHKVLLLPPDYTRLHSCCGTLCAYYYRILTELGCKVDVMPALGTHAAMTKEQTDKFFLGEIPYENLIVHDWRNDVVKLGEVPGEFVHSVSDGIVSDSIDVEVNRLITGGGYDLIISLGQVVPHEVVGMANYSKNIFVGCGGSSMISASHMLGAFYGLERIMGRADTPVRAVFDYAEEHFLGDVPLLYVLTVTTQTESGDFDGISLDGIFIGRGRKLFDSAATLAAGLNITHLGEMPSKIVCYLDPAEFKSTWLGNKAVYRTRLAIKTGGELLVLAPGVERFGEDAECDRLIRKYGYRGREKILSLVETEPELRANLSAAAHLIHGSSDGRFNVSYAAPLMTANEITGVGYGYTDYNTAVRQYDPDSLLPGWNTVNGEKIFFIPNPALGLWSV